MKILQKKTATLAGYLLVAVLLVTTAYLSYDNTKLRSELKENQATIADLNKQNETATSETASCKNSKEALSSISSFLTSKLGEMDDIYNGMDQVVLDYDSLMTDNCYTTGSITAQYNRITDRYVDIKYQYNQLISSMTDYLKLMDVGNVTNRL